MKMLAEGIKLQQTFFKEKTDAVLLCGLPNVLGKDIEIAEHELFKNFEKNYTD